MLRNRRLAMKSVDVGNGDSGLHYALRRIGLIAGIGVDIVEIERMEKLHARFGERLARRLLDAGEYEEYAASASKPRLLARRFAAKEAASKALGTGFSQGIGPTMIGVRHLEHGRPSIEFSGPAKTRSQQLGVSALWLSISDEKRYSVATVVLET
jgi:holo-[acyl-carrier protein] synthase